MLTSLVVHDILLIDRLTLDFQTGLNVLTGETGAGKSILLDSLGFVLGWRGRADLVRPGAAQGEVTAVFDLAPGDAAIGLLAELGFDGSELILRRTCTPDGRKQAFVNDRRVTGETLRQIGTQLVELHGQHDDQGLLDARGHRALLDAFAAHDGLLGDVRRAHATWAEAERRRDAAIAAQATADQDRDFLTHAVAELDKLAPQKGEDQALDARRRLMQQSARIGEDLTKVLATLGNDGAGGVLSDAQRRLDMLSGKVDGALDVALAALSRAIDGLGEAEDLAERFLQSMDFDPGALERTEERLFAIRGLARKHGVLPDDLADHAAVLTERLARITGGTAAIAALAKEAETARNAYERAAQALSDSRIQAARALDAAMATELPPLKLDRARFETLVARGNDGPEGHDQVRFQVATNPGVPAGAIDQIASGGELSRFLLALKVCLTRRSNGLTMIFDEIDRGVGGATADAVGRRLAALASEAQILVVTHSPQVAARGAHHWRVAKKVVDGATLSQVTPLGPDARRDEIARMLSGETVSDAARAAAAELLAG